jgi:hypothetical protein
MSIIVRPIPLLSVVSSSKHNLLQGATYVNSPAERGYAGTNDGILVDGNDFAVGYDLERFLAGRG